jgi:hypothetical protein
MNMGAVRLSPMGAVRSSPMLRARTIVAVDSWYDSGVRLSSQQPASNSAAAETPTRETAEEAWAKAPEGSFLSPALAAGLLAIGLALKIFVLEGGSPFG